jgi:pyruvate dehydrogenase E1 component beta subunit
MPIDILMPALSPTMEEGTLSKWLKQEGDKVTSGDVIAEIETDKATMEVEAVDEGVIGKLLVEAGTEGVKVNTPRSPFCCRTAKRIRHFRCALRLQTPQLRAAAAEKPAAAAAQAPVRPSRRHTLCRTIRKFRPAPKWSR